MAHKVFADSQKVTVLTDIHFGDHSKLDKYFQIIYCPETSMNAWRRMVKDGVFTIKCEVVVLCVGNCQLPLDPEISTASQMKKLVLTIWKQCAKMVKKVVILTGIPRPDKETELEEHLKTLNNGFYKEVREIRCYHPAGRNTGVMPVHCLFLEKYEYFDFNTGCNAYMIRVIKPVNRHFIAGTAKLNKVGLYHLRSYVLQELGFLSAVNSWEGMNLVHEPAEVQQDKRRVWLKTRQALIEQDNSEQGETDVEDEYPVTAVPDSLSECTDANSDGSSVSKLPVYVQGRLIKSGDVRL